jgi:hypothetical protein
MVHVFRFGTHRNHAHSYSISFIPGGSEEDDGAQCRFPFAAVGDFVRTKDRDVQGWLV